MEYIKENPVLTAIGVGALGLYLLYRKLENLPPGPMGWPVIGAYRHIASGNLHFDLLRIGQKYGDISSLYTGDKLLVALNSYSAIKEAFIDKAPHFSDRPGEKFDDLMQLHDEIFTPSYTEQWRKDKKFIQSTLKTFGFGTGKGEEKIKAEVDRLVQYIAKHTGEGLDSKNVVQRATANIITSVLCGSSWELDDPKVAAFIDMVERWSESFGECMFVPLMPEYVIGGKLGDMVGKTAELSLKVKAFFRKEIDEHIATLDPDSPRDFIDAYVIHRGVENLDYKLMVGTVCNLTPDATAVIAVAVAWILLKVTQHPEMQARLRREIDDVIGESRSPTLADRREMPYTEAVITEVLRMYPALAVTPPHSNREHGHLRRYHIPANSNIIANIWAVHHDADNFPEPETFRPERYLNDKGEFVKPERVIAFAVGKRACIGEHLSRAEMFLFTTSLLQKFTVSFPEENAAPEDDIVFEGIMPLPPPHKIVFNPR